MKLSPPQLVDHLCHELYLSRTPGDGDHLQLVPRRLLRAEHLKGDPADPASLLDLYSKVRHTTVRDDASFLRIPRRFGLLSLYSRARYGTQVRDDDTNPLTEILRLSGMVRVADGVLQVRNRIYERVFDAGWVTQHMPDAELRRQRAAYRRGLLRATAASAVIVAAMAALSLLAIRRTNEARQSADARAVARAVALRQATRERRRAEEQAKLAGTAERQTRVALGQAEDRRKEAVFQRGEALRQAGIARANEAEARRAKQDALVKLRGSYLAEARARRWSGQPGHRVESLAALARAAALNPPPELRLQLRNEAIAAMALPVDVGETVYSWRNAPGGPRVVGVDIDRRRYFRSDRYGGISVRDLQDDREIARLPGFGAPVRKIHRQSPDGRFLAVFYESEEHVVWDLARRKLLLHPGRIPNPEFSPDGRWLAAGGPRADGRLSAFALPSGKERAHLLPELRLMELQFQPSGRRVAAVLTPDSREVRILDLDTGQGVALPSAGTLWALD